jgi:hypothetical protein
MTGDGRQIFRLVFGLEFAKNVFSFSVSRGHVSKDTVS